MVDGADAVIINELANERNARSTQVAKPDAGYGSLLGSGFGGFGHSNGVSFGVTEWLFAQDMLTSRKERFNNFTVQTVCDDDADHVNVVRLDYAVPVGFVAFEPEAFLGVDSDSFGNVADSDEANFGEAGMEERAGIAVGVGVGFARHACADDCDTE